MAKRTIGELATLVTARVEPFKRGMKQAGDHTKKFKQEATGLTRFMDSKFAKSIAMGGAIGAGIAAANKLGDALRSAFTSAMDAARALFDFTANRLEKIDEQAKEAGQLGIDVQTLKRLERVLGKAGGDGIRTLQRFQRGVGETAEGLRTGEMSEVGKLFQQMGLANDAFLKEFTLPEQLIAFSDALAKVDPEERARVVQEAFGRAGVKLRELLEAGPFELMRQFDAQRVGFTDDVEAGRVEAFNDTVFDIKNNLSDFADELIVRATPALQKMADRVLAFTNALGEGDVDMTVNAVSAAFASLYDNTLKLVRVFDTISRFTPTGLLTGKAADFAGAAFAGATGGGGDGRNMAIGDAFRSGGMGGRLGQALADGSAARHMQALIDALDRNTETNVKQGIRAAIPVVGGFR